jgi:hypothetical protein
MSAPPKLLTGSSIILMIREFQVEILVSKASDRMNHECSNTAEREHAQA